MGTWNGTGTLAVGKDKAKIAFTVACKQTSAKFAVACTFDATGMPGMATYAERDLSGYEPNTDTLHWQGVTNAGETHDHVAKPGGGSKIRWIYTGTQDGKPFKEVIDMELGDKSVALRSESFVGGASVAVFDGKGVK